MGILEHKASAPDASAIQIAVVTVSDTRVLESDSGGALVEALLKESGFSVSGRQVVRDEPEQVRACVGRLVLAPVAASGEPRKADVILVTGGTGIAPRDLTVEAISPLFERTLAGFGELFRMLSFAEIGPAAMLSRACAGVVAGVPVFLIPGSTSAIRLALGRLILPELGHLLSELRRSPGATWASPDPQSPERHGHHPHGSDHRHRP